MPTPAYLSHHVGTENPCYQNHLTRKAQIRPLGMTKFIDPVRICITYQEIVISVIYIYSDNHMVSQLQNKVILLYERQVLQQRCQ